MSDTQTAGAPQAAPTATAIPLAALVARLPAPLTTIVQATPGPEAVLNLDAALLRDQLPNGSVSVSFHLIRQAAPAGVFADSASYDSVAVALPMEELLPRLPAALIERRPDQKILAVPAEVRAPFLRRGAGGAPAPRSDTTFTAATGHPHAPKPAIAVARGNSTGTAFLRAPIGELGAGWPEGLRREIAALGITGLALPGDEIGAALKTGRVAYTWRQLRIWTMPAPITQASSFDDVTLTLPMNVVTPLYLNHQYRAMGQVQTGHTSFSSRQRTMPSDVVRSAVGLAGVAGAFVASQQGLILAQQMPPGIVCDRLALLLPPTFNGLNQSAENLNLGDVACVGFNASGVSWLLFKAGQFFVAVAGRPGEPLPATQLQSLVADFVR